MTILCINSLSSTFLGSALSSETDVYNSQRIYLFMFKGLVFTKYITATVEMVQYFSTFDLSGKPCHTKE